MSLIISNSQMIDPGFISLCRLSVSRAIKPYAESNRPPEWFHQKNCVQQYYDMMEQLEHQQPKYVLKKKRL